MTDPSGQFDDEKYNISELWNGTAYNYWYAPKFLDGEYGPINTPIQITESECSD